MSLRCAHSPEDIKRTKSTKMFAKKIRVLYCSLLFVITLSVNAQESPGSMGQQQDFSDINEFILTEIKGETQYLKSTLNWMDIADLNMLTLRQMGQQNQATINQFSESGNPNLTLVLQKGEQNFTHITQSKGNNALDLVQKGKRNSFSADYDGEYLFNTIVQDGKSNVIEQTLRGSDLNFSIYQKGTGHELIQTESEPGTGYKVIQTGKDMKIKIDQGHVMRK